MKIINFFVFDALWTTLQKTVPYVALATIYYFIAKKWYEKVVWQAEWHSFQVSVFWIIFALCSNSVSVEAYMQRLDNFWTS